MRQDKTKIRNQISKFNKDFLKNLARISRILLRVKTKDKLFGKVCNFLIRVKDHKFAFGLGSFKSIQYYLF
jgi:hypothetical protein